VSAYFMKRKTLLRKYFSNHLGLSTHSRPAIDRHSLDNIYVDRYRSAGGLCLDTPLEKL
jgi:hypothetical protein